MTDHLRETDAQPLDQWRMDRLYRDLDGVKQAEILGWKADLTWGEVASLIATIDRQGKALRAVEKELDSMDEMAKMSVPPEYHNVARWLRAALAQTEPQTADEAKENTLDG